MAAQAGRVRVRVVALITRGTDVLVIEQSDGKQAWNCFPGGQLEHGETLGDCLVRELDEELSVEVEVGELVACGTYVEGSTTSLEMYFRCTPRGDELAINEAHILKARYLPAAELPRHQVFPLEIARDLAELLSGVDCRGVYYYGRFA